MTDRPDPIATPTRGDVVLTITVFGDNDPFDRALSEELGRRGCRTHAVSVETGWLRSAENVICRIDTESGQRALEGLAGHDQPRATIVAVCEKPDSERAATRLHDMCEECGRHHDVSLIWYSPVAEAPAAGRPPLEQLAVSVVNEVSERVGGEDGRPFTTRYVDLAG